MLLVVFAVSGWVGGRVGEDASTLTLADLLRSPCCLPAALWGTVGAATAFVDGMHTNAAETMHEQTKMRTSTLPQTTKQEEVVLKNTVEMNEWDCRQHK